MRVAHATVGAGHTARRPLTHPPTHLYTHTCRTCSQPPATSNSSSSAQSHGPIPRPKIPHLTTSGPPPNPQLPPSCPHLSDVVLYDAGVANGHQSGLRMRGVVRGTCRRANAGAQVRTRRMPAPLSLHLS